ncbi:hypothetical protein M430DRAFT_64411, partial [Amorphotheca resinae ATCC 22711]
MIKVFFFSPFSPFHLYTSSLHLLLLSLLGTRSPLTLTLYNNQYALQSIPPSSRSTQPHPPAPHHNLNYSSHSPSVTPLHETPQPVRPQISPRHLFPRPGVGAHQGTSRGDEGGNGRGTATRVSRGAAWQLWPLPNTVPSSWKADDRCILDFRIFGPGF